MSIETINDRLEQKIDALHTALDKMATNYAALVTNQSLMQQEIQVLTKAITKLEDIDRRFLVCQGDCQGKVNLLKSEIENTEANIKEISKRISFRDKILIGMAVTIFLRIFLYVLLGVKV